MGPCMCGDLQCYSCGPAQGNDYCPYCGIWSMDVEDGMTRAMHRFAKEYRPVNTDTGCLCTPKELAEFAEADRQDEEHMRELEERANKRALLYPDNWVSG